MQEFERLTLAERVGQLFLIGFQGTRPDSETRELISRIRPAGLVFSQRNIASLDQIYDLNTQFVRNFETPPFLAIDQEGGALDRLKQAVAPVPSLADLADSGTSFVRSGARLIASELQAAGFNTSLSLLLDLGLGGSVVRERCLAAGAREVSRLARVELSELRRKNILATASHFPGLGGAHEDPHFSLPTVRRTRRQLFTEDLAPFESLVGELDLIRVSHAHYPALGDIRPLPAILSRRIVTDLLRGVLGFGGVVMTDDLTMGAVTSRGLKPETFLEAIRAGNDLILFRQATPLVGDAFDLIVARAGGDRELRSGIDRSAERILHLKRRLDSVPLRNRVHRRARLVRQIDRLRNSIPDIERVEVR